MAQGSADPPAVVVDRLRVVRGGRAVVRGIGFEVARGTITGLLGPNGCGKTTLLRSIVGVQVVAGGTVTVLGRPAGDGELRRRIGYATQDPALYADLTVSEALRYFATVLGSGPSSVDRVLADVGLEGSARTLVGRLSGGQRARANLAAALLGEPALLVLDEPTVGADPELREHLWRLFRARAAAGTTLLVSSHVMDEAARCDQLLLMRDGALLAAATPSELRRRTETEDLEQAFLRLIRKAG
ncbi:ABC transporter ATP-binding protein [Amycolatopsis sp. CA-230715]|uniref:ABC transporter ATP-binding protein n=1 Tax=Amycolatopsis sp. CA-230715 TaxID=2745196 RepID=UPI001C02CC3A|nr:ABC transporter ATP-binding protein [Amycolatopsis sp. CA-230715]QWF77922.1 putative multidrug ABC transporter ATP-binding protein YbhF [Amycolatopsis sp. CA-230715]